MARKPRQYGDTGIYHIILRGNNQENLFYDDSDSLFFLNRLHKYVRQLNIELYSYCLMGNHVHLLIGNGNYYMPLLIKKITCSYVYYFNHKYERTGHLFQGRYKSEPIEELEYFKTVYRYIIQNPEKVGIQTYENYRWNSFHMISEDNNILNNHFVINIFGKIEALYRFLEIRNNDICMENYLTKYVNNDDNVIKLIKELFNIQTPLDISKMEINRMNASVRFLKKIGLPVSQISRLTSINKKIIRDA